MFIRIDNKELEECVEHNIVTLNKKLELEKAIEKEVVKQAFEKPRRQFEAALFIPKIEKNEKA